MILHQSTEAFEMVGGDLGGRFGVGTISWKTTTIWQGITMMF